MLSIAPLAAAAQPTAPLAPLPALRPLGPTTTQPLAVLPGLRPPIPPPGAGLTNQALRESFQSVNSALTNDPAIGSAAMFDYVEALERYRAGDYFGARNAASRAQAIAGNAQDTSPITPLAPLKADFTPIVPPNPFQGPQGSYEHPATTAPANPLLAEDPTDAELATVRNDLDIAKDRVNTAPAEAAYAHALARRRAGDEKGAYVAAQHALNLVRDELAK